VAASAGLAACGQGDGGNAAENAVKNVAANTAGNAAAPAAGKAAHPTYCFFKEANRKGWSVTRDKSGNVVVKGQAKVEDVRYSAALGDPEVEGDTARVWLTMPQNSSYQDLDRWWDVSATIAGSAEVTSVSVMCGAKEVATLGVRR
jgi:hypothetical protein